jgi:hypothetical protein
LDGALGDHSAVNLIDDAINLLRVERVRDDLVAGNDILVVDKKRGLVKEKCDCHATSNMPLLGGGFKRCVAHLENKHLEYWLKGETGGMSWF